MREYLANGARLAWLIDPSLRQVEIHRPGVDAKSIDAPVAVAADPVLPGFVLQLAPIWEPGL